MPPHNYLINNYIYLYLRGKTKLYKHASVGIITQIIV